MLEADVRWHRMLVQLQRELTQEAEDMRRSHVLQLRARLLSAVNPDAWTERQDQLMALLTAMLVIEVTEPVTEDATWVATWGKQLSQFIH
eukprot:s2033_g8.t1